MHDPLRQRRSTHRSRRRWPFVLGVIVIVIVIAVAVYAVFLTPLLTVQNIVFVYSQPGDSSRDIVALPSRALREDEKNILRENLEVYLKNSSNFFALFGNRFIFAWPMGTVSADFIKQKAPYATDIEIERNYFTREIKIIITPREPIGAWCMIRTATDSIPTNAENTTGNVSSSPEASVSSPHESVCWWFDKNGITGAEAPLTSGNLTINVMDYSGRSIDLDHAVLDSRQFAGFLKILEVLKTTGVAVRSFIVKDAAHEEIHAAPTLSFPELYFSLRNDPSFALIAIQELKKIGFAKIKYADLRVEGRVYYVLR